MWSSEDFRRAESAIFAGALLGLLLVLLGVGRGADLALLDRMQLYEEPEPARVAILDLDDRTLRAYGWPVDPGLYAAVFELLTASGAKGVGVDLEFAPAGVSLGPAAEVEVDPADALMGQVAEARGVVFGVQSLRRRGTKPPARCGKDENAPVAPLRVGLEDCLLYTSDAADE